LVSHAARRLAEADAGSFSTFLAILRVYSDDAESALNAILDHALPTASKLEDKVARAKWQAKAGVALAIMCRGEKVWAPLKHSPDPTLRSFLIDRLGPGGVEARILWSRFEQEPDTSIKRAILLSLGELETDHLTHVERQNLIPHLVQLYREEPDSGIHCIV